LNALAPIIDLDEWRFSDLAPSERAVLLTQRAQTKPRATHGWGRLLGANLSDARDGASILASLGGHPIAVHGARRDGGCTCGNVACETVGKHPVSNRWQTEPLDSARLDATLRERFELNIGWRMGKQPNGWRLVCVDVDGGRDLLAPLVAKWGELPPTLSATSGRGLHLIFRLSAEAPDIRNRRGVAPNVDIRGEGGQIVIAPSRHASGRVYRWLDAREPAVLP